jgi:uncharacterized protein (DUF433 family)/predicted nuclease of predicted toxin-antitoxin system
VNWQSRIAVDPKILVGKPVVRGTRIAVSLVLELKATGWTDDQILANYPGLTIDDIRACLAYAKDLLDQEWVYPLSGS